MLVLEYLIREVLGSNLGAVGPLFGLLLWLPYPPLIRSGLLWVWSLASYSLYRYDRRHTKIVLLTRYSR